VPPVARQPVHRTLRGANRQKPSGIAAKKTVLDVRLVSSAGTKRLDEISNEDSERHWQCVAHLQGQFRNWLDTKT